MALVRKPIPDEHVQIAPSIETNQDLHALCGGDPSEIQLYCHHMYRKVEDGVSKQMELVPPVFRDVLHEYRAISPANIDSVLNAIERLPDKVLFESDWLARRNLSLEENIYVEELVEELKQKKKLSEEVQQGISDAVKSGYSTLFQAGITEVDGYLRLTGAPLTAGFWKSFVEAEKKKRWTWIDSSFQDSIKQTLVRFLQRDCQALTTLEVNDSSDSSQAVDALRMLRGSKEPVSVQPGSVIEMIPLLAFAKVWDCRNVVDVEMQLASPAGRQTFTVRFLEGPSVKLSYESFQKWIEARNELLSLRDITFRITGAVAWIVPTFDEMTKLGKIVDVHIPPFLERTATEEAVTRFRKGDTAGAAAYFERSLDTEENRNSRNNLGFCQILLGQLPEALGNIEKAIAAGYEPLFGLNKGLALFLTGERKAAAKLLRDALAWLREPEKACNPRAGLYVLILRADGRSVKAESGLPIDAAILINLVHMGEETAATITDQLALSSLILSGRVYEMGEFVNMTTNHFIPASSRKSQSFAQLANRTNGALKE